MPHLLMSDFERSFNEIINKTTNNTSMNNYVNKTMMLSYHTFQEKSRTFFIFFKKVLG